MSEKHRAALFCRSFLPYSETFIYDEVRHHTRWAVEVFTRRRENRDAFPYEPVLTPGGRLSTLAYGATTYARAFDRALRASGHRLLHAHFGTSGVFAWPYAARLRLPLVVTFHGYDVAALLAPAVANPKLWRYRALAPLILGRADLMLCASEELCDIVARVSRRPDATRLYRIGIDLTRFHRAVETRATPRVTMVGRFVEKKGHLDGIEAFARAVARGSNAELTLVGAGPLAPRYAERVRQLGIGARVRFAGVLPMAEVAELLARTDVLLAPSRVARDGDRESGLMVAKEAAAASAPVVGTKHGGIPEIIDDGVTGFLVDEGDVDAMADRLLALLADASLRERMGRAARAKMVREYDLRERVAALEELYDSLL
jgi:glycosyltransferase involved in cell wall biosynthesis